MTSSKPLESKPFANAIAVMTDLAAAGVRLAPPRYIRSSGLYDLIRSRSSGESGTGDQYRKLCPSVWNAKRALALTHEADTIAASLGAFGTDPIITAAAERCVEALGKQDMATLRAACFAIEDRARALAAIANKPPQGESHENNPQDSKEAA